MFLIPLALGLALVLLFVRWPHPVEQPADPEPDDDLEELLDEPDPTIFGW